MNSFIKIWVIGLLLLFTNYFVKGEGDIVTAGSEEVKMTIYPNPVVDETITVNAEKEIQKIELLNIVGQQIHSEKIASANTVKLKLNLESGIYIIKVTFTDNSIATKRLWVN